MEFGILGPLLVRDDSGPRAVHAAKQRILLAALLVRPEQTVALGTLADILWDGRPPLSHVATMRNYVMRLRQRLGSAGYRVKTSLGGYQIDVEKHEFDVLRFARLRAGGAGEFRAGAYDRAARLLGDALGVWRGPVLADVPSDTLHRDEAPRLDRMRLEAVELKLTAQLLLGGHDGLVAELRALTAAHPDRERFWAQLMVALARGGDQADALTVYLEAQRTLVRDYGVEPGTRLRQLYRDIQTGSSTLDRPLRAMALEPMAR
jgi:DNA-binding SARP family transcriptional activator